MSEHDEQVALFAAVKLWKIPELQWLFAIPNGGARHPAVGRRMKDEGVRAGVWDIMLPVAKQGYHGLFLEMKYGDNKLSPKQEEFGEFVQLQGYCIRVAYSWEQALEILKEYIGYRKEEFISF